MTLAEGEGTRASFWRASFWRSLDELAASGRVELDRPRGSRHPRWPEIVYPLDYGCLADVRSSDGGMLDIWVGSLAERRVTGVVCTVDLHKRDSEVKVLLGCTPDEMRVILAFHNTESQSGILVERGSDE
jgi:inorganic pyrophosphatase